MVEAREPGPFWTVHADLVVRAADEDEAHNAAADLLAALVGRGDLHGAFVASIAPTGDGDLALLADRHTIQMLSDVRRRLQGEGESA